MNIITDKAVYEASKKMICFQWKGIYENCNIREGIYVTLLIPLLYLISIVMFCMTFKSSSKLGKKISRP